MGKHLDTATMITLVITFVLFVVALFAKGLTHDLLLEAGVFLVSVKLVIMSYKASTGIEVMNAQLEAIAEGVRRLEQSRDRGTGT